MLAMSHTGSRRPVNCTTCEVGIVGRPVFRAGVPFCCAGCAGGGPCTCSYDRDQAPDDDLSALAGIRYCLDVRELVMAGPPTMSRGRPGMLTHE